MRESLPAFFVPFSEPGKHESDYTSLVERFGCIHLEQQKRIYAVSFMHNGVHWNAMVGKSLDGTELRTVRRRGRRIEQRINHGDNAVVIAILDHGAYFLVVTDGGASSGAGSRWLNPFIVGKPPLYMVTFPAEKEA